MKFSFELMRKEMISSNDRHDKFKKAGLTKRLRALARFKCKLGVNVPYSDKKPCEVIVTIYSPTRRTYDPPNFWPTVKALQDGMTDAGIWTDDNKEVITFTGFRHGGLSGSKCYRVEIGIRDI